MHSLARNAGATKGDFKMMTERPWWLKNADTRKSRRFANWELAKAAAVRAYRRKTAQGFDAKDTFFLMSGGEIYSVGSFMEMEVWK